VCLVANQIARLVLYETRVHALDEKDSLGLDRVGYSSCIYMYRPMSNFYYSGILRVEYATVQKVSVTIVVA